MKYPIHLIVGDSLVIDFGEAKIKFECTGNTKLLNDTMLVEFMINEARTEEQFFWVNIYKCWLADDTLAMRRELGQFNLKGMRNG